MSKGDGDDPQANGEKAEQTHQQGNGVPETPASERKKLVVVGLGMVGIAFIEKVIKLDAKRREYDVIVIGEEPHVAYNRVGLTTFFQHRNVEELYLNSEDWYKSMPQGSLNYHLNTMVTEIHQDEKIVVTSKGDEVSYDVLVLATGSDALLPRHTPGHDANGVFVYRTIDDLQKLIRFAADHKGTTGAVVGGGLLGLEAAKAMMDLEDFGKVKLIERNRWVMSRQLDSDAGSMVVEQVRDLGLDVMLSKRVGRINVDDNNNVTGVTFEDGEDMECSCVCFAIGIKPRDELAKKSGIRPADRGSGIAIDDQLQTSSEDIYAIGECASFGNATFGLIAPGIEMADVLAFNLTQAKAHSKRKFTNPDLSTKLKLLGVEVASFGDFFADRDGPKHLPKRRHGDANGAADKKNDSESNKKKDEAAKDSKTRSKGTTQAPAPAPVKALTYKDPFLQVYKKYLFTLDGKYLLGGMMIGDTKDYVKLVPMVKGQKALEKQPSELIIGSKSGDDDDDLPDDTQICSCNNVLKKDITAVIKDGSCKSPGDVKSCTKAGTGCGGCMPLVQTIFNKTMEAMGQEVKNNLCPHFEHSRADLYNIVRVKNLDSFESVMKNAGRDAESTGCEACKPAIASILASLYNKHIIEKSRRGMQDSNDRFLGNIQRNGTFSVIPRVSGGEITPEKLIIIGTVAKKYGLYTKITGGQRIDMFGAKKQDLLAIWTELVEGGMESGHAYAKSLRTVKSCVGTTWCRFGIGDSVGMAVRLEERYKSIRSPHKLKGGVSGCVRECAEAQSKDFGLIATEKGYNIFVGGNGGATPRHTDLLAQDVPPDDVVPILDRYLAFYIRTADKLQRTARWIENLPGGIKYLREVVLDDKLGICADLEAQMEELVGTFFCEWTETIKDPERRKIFQQFANTSDTLEGVEMVSERGQPRPAYWAPDAATEDFRGTQWTSELAWQPLVEQSSLVDVATGSAVSVKRGDTQLAIFRVKGKYYCTQQMCPHKRAFALSEGLIGDDSAADKLWVSCPYHKRNFELKGASAGACTNDETMSIATFTAEARDDGWVYAKLPSVEELDSVLGTSKWKVRKGEAEDPFVKMDEKLRAMRIKGTKGRKIVNGVTAATANGVAAVNGNGEAGTGSDADADIHGPEGVNAIKGGSHLENGMGQEAKAQSILAGGERMDW